MSGSFCWIRWKRRAVKGGVWTQWHGSHHGDTRTLCGINKPSERKDFEVREQISEYDDDGVPCQVCLSIGLAPK